MKQTQIETSGFHLDVEYEFDNGELADVDGPGQPPRADIHSIKHQGFELIELLSASAIASMESQVYWQECAK
jgi:hypothetical protein